MPQAAYCKLCSRENMDHIDRAGGRFVTVLPRSRSEDEEFRKWIQMDPNTYAGLDLRFGPSPSSLCRWTARPLVRLSAAIAVGGGLDGGLGVEHVAHPAPGG
jgi:hypothetical protein